MTRGQRVRARGVNPVAPRAGARIETDSWCRGSYGVRVAPRAGARIETFKYANSITHMIGLSPPVRGRGLKHNRD